MKRSNTLTTQDGFSLLEVLFAAFIVAVAIVGMTLILSRSHFAVIAQGDTRIALYLAEQKMERLRGLGFSSVKVGNQTNTGCGDATANNEPCYNETGDASRPPCATLIAGSGSCYNAALLAGAGRQGATTQVDTQVFTRLTCVRWVQDDNPELPADPLEPPSSWNCPSCDPTKPNCTKSTRRVKVAVIPRLLGDAGATSRPVDANRVTMEMLLTVTAEP